MEVMNERCNVLSSGNKDRPDYHLHKRHMCLYGNSHWSVPEREECNNLVHKEV